jgi:hypothetical protein
MSNLLFPTCLASCATAGGPLSDTGSGAILNTESGAGFLQQGYFNSTAQNTTVYLYAQGVISTPGSGTATIQFKTYADSTQGTASTALGASGAITPASSLSNALWILESWTTVQSISGANAVTVTYGRLTLPGGASTVASSPYQFGSTSTVNLSMTSAWYVESYAIWGSAVSGCTLTLEQQLVFSYN